MPAFTHPPEPGIVAMVISSTPEHVVIALEVSREMLARHEHFLQALLAAARTPPGRD